MFVVCKWPDRVSIRWAQGVTANPQLAESSGCRAYVFTTHGKNLLPGPTGTVRASSDEVYFSLQAEETEWGKMHEGTRHRNVGLPLGKYLGKPQAAGSPVCPQLLGDILIVPTPFLHPQLPSRVSLSMVSALMWSCLAPECHIAP